MEVNKLAALEAVIFSAGEPVTESELSNILELSKSKLREYLEVLKKEYDKNSHGIELKRYGDGYKFVTKPDYADFIKELHEGNRQVSLSRAALETLAIIAYRQPVTRAEIEEIRGVKAEKTLLTLSRYNLIQELGRKETIGNPIVYGTTEEFLQHFDLEDLSRLPELEEID
ncbi:MAG: SMC-Scp complex subunit ScpB [Halanaerobiales bacterium]